MPRLMLRFAAALALLCAGAGAASAQLADHPQISRLRAYRSIHELENLIAYLQANPYHYGGRKDATIAAARATIENLRAAMGAPAYWVPYGCCYTRRPIIVR